MKPRWRSEWMRPAASGAVAPRWTSQALVSSSPVVRKVIRSRSRQAAPTTWSRPPRSTPYPRSRSAASSGGSSAASASRAAATATVGRPSLASTSAARSAAAAASASARLSTARAGLRVRGAKFRSTLASSGSQWAVRRGVPWSSRSRARARTSASRAASFTPALAFLAAFSAPPPIDSRSATVSSRVSSAAASTGSGALSSQAARTMARASASRRAPSPWADRPPPADSPATSTKRAATFTRLRERSSSDRTSTRGSGTDTAATLALPAAPPAGTPARVSALKRVVLPLWGSPTMPTSLMGKAYRFGVHPRCPAADRETMQTAITRTSGPGRVLLVDDHPAVRRVLRSLLEEVGGWQVVGEADSGEAAIPLVEQLAPDVVLMDCRMPGLGGVATTREIVQRWPEVAVVAHTAYADETYVREMVAAGARGYVLKGDVPAAVLEALSAARQGQARLAAAGTGPVMEDLRELYEAAVSRSKELEAENADLSSTVARLEEVDRLKDEFLAMVSHELRTPITVVLGMAQTLVGRPDMAATADGQEILRRVVRQGKRLRDMVEQLLQASAFVANRSPVLRAEEVMAAEVAAEVVDDWRLAEPDRRVEFLLPTQPRSIHGDAEALRMVVGNLVDNAGKHAPPGTPIRVLVLQPPGMTRIEVLDQGQGVAAIDRERIFAPFTQLDASTTRRVGGVGLGLFLVDRLVRGMGGQVWVEDNQGGGARFVVELPDLAPV